jgi:asparagine synthase (glutamine-hydrolysing)
VPLDYGAASVDDFLDVCAAQEKPFPLIGNVLGLPALYREIAAHDIRVVLDGTGADEVFAGYWRRQSGFAVRDALRAADIAWVDAAIAGGQLPDDLADYARGRDPDRALPVPEPERLSVDDTAFLKPAVRTSVACRPLSDPLAGFKGSLADALRLDIAHGRLPEWLWQNDRSAMRFGVENRSPFLDRRLLRFVDTGYRAKLGGPWNKRELRALFDRFTPLPTATRREKQGFRWVYGRFLRANRARLLELLSASRTVGALVDLPRLLDSARRTDAMLESRLAQRLLPLAGLEARGLLDG